MSKSLIILLSVVFTVFSANALPFLEETPSVFTDYRIPSFGYNTADAFGNDLLNIHHHGDDGYFRANLGGNFLIMNQSSDISWRVRDRLEFKHSNTYNPNTPNVVTSKIVNNLSFNYSQWFMGYSGIHGFASGNFYSETIKDQIPVLNFPFEVGAGYGRVQSVYPVVLAVILNDEMGSGLSDAQLMEIAEIVGKRELHIYNYADDFNMKYYVEIAEKLGKTDQVMKIHQIITSAVYKRTGRNVGWHLRLSYTNLLRPRNAPNHALKLSGLYTKPVGYKTYLNAFANLYYSLKKDTNPDLVLGISGIYDHNYHWFSSVNLSHTFYGSKSFLSSGVTYDNMFRFSLRSSMCIYNIGLITGDMGLSNRGKDNNATIDFKINFAYFLW
ncbi:MAG: hypothetical protein HQ568_04970 [Calditrichaeota bacterium]|nr:hypothetical protein [Calditrichota bacterium]